MAASTPHRADIQGLRALAVLLVVLAHAGVSFLPGGFVGVDVFFVLSGFLITGLLLAEAGANFRFAARGMDYFAQATPPSPLLHYWSLAVEEQFYLVWPALLSLVLFGVALVRRRRRVGRRQERRLLLVVVLLAAIS